MRPAPKFEQGTNNITVYKDGRVLKTRKECAIVELAFPKQMTAWNKYYAGTSYATAEIAEDGRLSTPYIEGRHPTDEELADWVETHLAKGILMGDCRDNRNFVVNEAGGVCPVDFGQVYSLEDNRMLYVGFKARVESQLREIKSRSVAAADDDFVMVARPVPGWAAGRARKPSNNELNERFLQRLCNKAQQKVKSRWSSLGIAGKRIHVGDKSYVVPDHMARAINDSRPNISSAPDNYKKSLLDQLRKYAETKSSSRDDWTQELYNGSTNNPSAFFREAIADHDEKAVPLLQHIGDDEPRADSGDDTSVFRVK